MSIKLSEKVQNKLNEVVEVWADEFLVERPKVLGYAVCCQLEKVLIEQTEKIEETFKPEVES